MLPHVWDLKAHTCLSSTHEKCLFSLRLAIMLLSGVCEKVNVALILRRVCPHFCLCACTKWYGGILPCQGGPLLFCLKNPGVYVCVCITASVRCISRSIQVTEQTRSQSWYQLSKRLSLSKIYKYFMYF